MDFNFCQTQPYKTHSGGGPKMPMRKVKKTKTNEKTDSYKLRKTKTDELEFRLLSVPGQYSSG